MHGPLVSSYHFASDPTNESYTPIVLGVADLDHVVIAPKCMLVFSYEHNNVQAPTPQHRHLLVTTDDPEHNQTLTLNVFDACYIMRYDPTTRCKHLGCGPNVSLLFFTDIDLHVCFSDNRDSRRTEMLGQYSVDLRRRRCLVDLRRRRPQ